MLSLAGQPLQESHFTYLPGQQNNMVYYIMQDQAGYIWMGTDAGALRYDGKAFKHFTTEDGLSDNEVLQIREDARGRIWFLTYNGRLSCYDKGQIHAATQLPFLETISAGSLSAGWMQQGDSTWYFTRRKCYLFINEQLKGEWLASQIFPQARSGFSEVSYYDGRFVLISTQGIFEPITSQLIHFPKSQNTLPDNKIIIRDDCLYYYSQNKVYRYDRRSEQFSAYSTPAGQTINAWHYQPKNSAILIATEKAVYQFSLSSCSFSPLLNTPPPFPSYLYADAQQNIWVGTRNDGVWLNRHLPGHLFSPTTQLNTQEAHSLGLWNGRVYAGYLNSEYMVWENGRASWRQSFPPAGFSRSYGFAMLDRQPYSLSGSQLINVQSGNSFSIPGAIKALAVKDDTAFVGLSFSVTAIAAKTLLDKKQDPSRFIREGRQIFDKRVYCLLMASDTLWMGSDEGLIYYDGTGKSRPLQSTPSTMQRKINRMIKTDRGLFAVATAGAGIAFREAGNWHLVASNHGLPSNNCNSLFAAGDSVLWVGTDKGLSKIKLICDKGPCRASIENFTTKDGLPAETINDVLIKDDTIWVATPLGVAYIRESQLINRQTAAVTIEEVWVNGARFPVPDRLELSHSDNNIRIDFTALSFSLPANQEYAYRLEGADTKWNLTSTPRIQYSNLSPGNYTFMVTAGDPRIGNPALTQLQFRILSPFWQRPVFLWTTGLLLSAVLFLLIRWRLRSIQQKNVLEQTALRLNKEKAELEQKASAMQMNPHFLFNALNAIKGYYGSGNRESGDTYTSRLAGLMRLILEKNAQPQISLHDELNMLKLYLELACQQKPGKFNFNINMPMAIDTQLIFLPPLLIQPFVENAVMHGLGPIKNGGQLEIKFTITGDMLQCEVSDNGVGLQQSAVLNKYRIHESKGISITRQRLRLLSERSQLSINELQNESGVITGTRVLISFPVAIKFTHHARNHY